MFYYNLLFLYIIIYFYIKLCINNFLCILKFGKIIEIFCWKMLIICIVLLIDKKLKKKYLIFLWLNNSYEYYDKEKLMLRLVWLFDF